MSRDEQLKAQAAAGWPTKNTRPWTAARGKHADVERRFRFEGFGQGECFDCRQSVALMVGPDGGWLRFVTHEPVARNGRPCAGAGAAVDEWVRDLEVIAAKIDRGAAAVPSRRG
jgi:hypothetical protein